MGWAEDGASKTRAPKRSMVAEMKQKLFSEPMILPDFVPNCSMFYGLDNTAKTGLGLASLSEQDIKDGKKVVIVDLDLGTVPLLVKYHKDKVNSGNIIYHNPIRWGEDEKGNPIIDYEETIGIIKAIGVAISEEWKNENIKTVILDGGSKYLKYSEQQMRIEKALTPDGGVSQRYWIVRNKIFLEGLELYKSLPIHKIFIFHEDFIPEEAGSDQISAVKLQTNQMMFQKILCERVDTGANVKINATIHKSKGEITKEGKRIEFANVNKDDETFVWEPQKVLEQLGF